MAKADVTSEIVGYQQITIPQGWAIYTTTFKNVDGSQVDLNSIYFLRADGSAFATSGKTNVCKGKIRVQKINSDGSYATSYSWYSTIANTDGKAWTQDGGATTLADGVETLKDGEAFAINNDTGASVLMQVSGAVELTPQNAVATGWSLMGNSTPVDIDLTAVSFLRADGSAFATSGKTNVCKGKIRVQKINSDGSYATSYSWYSTIANTDGKAWTQDGGATTLAADVETIKAGEAFAINNDTGAAVIMVLPSPIQ